jgi:hypothetical protein
VFPNMGDYNALIADGMNVYANWSDGRDGTPDSYFARLVDGAVAVEPSAERERVFSLHGLQPLRSGGVRVLLSLPAAGAVRVDVVDLAGRRVAASALAHVGAGDHALEIGEALAAGVYFVRAERSGVCVTTKAVAVR